MSSTAHPAITPGTPPGRVRRAVLGVTLLELLIGMTILAVMLLTFSRFFTSSVTVSRNLDVRNELLADAQTAQQVVTFRLQEAWHVYPASTAAVTFKDIADVAEWQVTAPGGSTDWDIGTDPVVAFMVPPVNVDGACTPTTTPAVTTGCYEFYAYFPISRTQYVTNTTTQVANRIPADPQNPNAAVLMQLSGFVSPDALTSGAIAPPGLTSTWLAENVVNARVDLLADYFVSDYGDRLPFEMDDTATNPRSVDVQMRLQRVHRGRTIAVGGTDEFAALTNVVTARNHGIQAP